MRTLDASPRLLALTSLAAPLVTFLLVVLAGQNAKETAAGAWLVNGVALLFLLVGFIAGGVALRRSKSYLSWSIVALLGILLDAFLVAVSLGSLVAT
ncbi:MAG: hypothetical protein BIFFINMI_02061 [Phycisphaerae bacterium]|nr:hypothetical protein [Phycisphaerae bacterium]